jgi:hypothetical protein
MCASCGCGIPEDKHGEDRNIALERDCRLGRGQQHVSDRGPPEHAEDGGGTRLALGRVRGAAVLSAIGGSMN